MRLFRKRLGQNEKLIRNLERYDKKEKAKQQESKILGRKPVKCKTNKLRKKHSVISLWDETNEMAKEENKTPVITLAEKNRKGFWIMIHSSDLHKLEGYGKSEMEGSNIRKEEPKTNRSAQETNE